MGGVYKLAAVDGQPKMKITSDMAKATHPGSKQVLRVVGPEGQYIQDLVCLEGEAIKAGITVYDPTNPLRQTDLPEKIILTDLRRTVMQQGRRTLGPESLDRMAERCRRDMELLPSGCRRFVNPHRYKVSISPQLKELRCAMIRATGMGMK